MADEALNVPADDREVNESDPDASTAKGKGNFTDAGEDGHVERQQWGNDFQFLLSSIGYGVGFGNVWRFPYLVYRYGGGVFLIPFVFFLLIVALPLMLLESSVAQYAGLGPLHIYSMMCPAMKGCGITALYIAYCNSVQYIIIMGYVVRYMASSFSRKLPWVDCDPTYSYDGCYGGCRGSPPGEYLVLNGTCHSAGDFCVKGANGTECKGSDGASVDLQHPAFSFFYDKVLALRMPNGGIADFENFGYIVPTMFGSVFVAYVLTGLVLEQGVSTAGKVVYFTATFPYFGLTVLLIRAALLPGFMDGIYFYLVPDISQLWQFEVWYQALSQTFFSLGVGFGGLMTLSSYNKFKTPIWRLCVFNACVNLFTSLLAGFVIFGSLGYIAHVTGQPVEDVAGSGYSLTFITFPTTLSLLPGSAIWSVLFFFMLITVGIDTQMGDMETQITSALDHFVWIRKYKSYVTFGLCALGMISASTMTFQGGFWLNALFNDYAATAPVLILALANIVTFTYIFGGKKCIGQMEEMCGTLKKPNKWYMLTTWMVIAPLFTFILLIYFFIDFRGTYYDKPAEDKPFEPWVQYIGVALAIVPIIFIPSGIIHEFVKRRLAEPEKPVREIFREMFQPRKNFMSQEKRKEIQRISFIELMQPTRDTQYVAVLPNSDGQKRSVRYSEAI